MFNPGWAYEATPGRINAPLVVKREFQASPKWHAQHPGSMDAVGDALLNETQHLILNWLQGQRQNASVSNLMVYRNTYVLPGVTAEYTKQFGHETLRLIATPENRGGKIPTTFEVPMNGVINIKVEFKAWPLPGYDAGDFMDLMDNYYSFSHFTENPWDFANAPAWPGIDGSALTAGSVLTDFISSDQPMPEGDWQRTGSGSKVFNQPLTGKQYWEVEILEMPSGTPSTLFRANEASIGGGSSAHCRVFDSDASGASRKWPQELDTWLTPGIGVLPEDGVVRVGGSDPPTYKESTPGVMGLEIDPNVGVRSVYVTRASFLRDIVNTTTWTNGSYTLTGADGTGAAGQYRSDPPNVFFVGENPITASPRPGPRPPDVNRPWHLGDIIANGGDIFQNVTDNLVVAFGATVGSGPSSGPPEGAPAGTGPVDFTIHWSGMNWLRIAQVGIGVNASGDGTVISGTTCTKVDGFTTEDSQSQLFGDTKLVGSSETFDDGEYAPVLQGRADSNGGPTGIDLGTLNVGDIVRIATDIKFDDQTDPKSSGKIYFGKNKLWYGQAVTSEELTETADYWTLLDPDWATDGPAKFFAAVSWRMGRFRARILGTGAIKFKLPQGYKVLPITPDAVKIPGPDVDDPKA